MGGFGLDFSPGTEIPIVHRCGNTVSDGTIIPCLLQSPIITAGVYEVRCSPVITRSFLEELFGSSSLSAGVLPEEFGTFHTFSNHVGVL